jgi:hypothetical protein
MKIKFLKKHPNIGYNKGDVVDLSQQDFNGLIIAMLQTDKYITILPEEEKNK